VPAPAKRRHWQIPSARLDVYLVDESRCPFLTAAVAKWMRLAFLRRSAFLSTGTPGNPPQAAGPSVIKISIGVRRERYQRRSWGDDSARFTITLYLDRIRELQARMSTAGSELFGHVLAHEIGHVLQGVPRHSEAGILRGRCQGTICKYVARRLTFTPQDVEQIWRGPVLNQKRPR